MVYHPNAAQVRNAARLYMSQGFEGTSALNVQGYTTADITRAQLHRALCLKSGDVVSLRTVEHHMAEQFPVHPSERGWYKVTGI